MSSDPCFIFPNGVFYEFESSINYYCCHVARGVSCLSVQLVIGDLLIFYWLKPLLLTFCWLLKQMKVAQMQHSSSQHQDQLQQQQPQQLPQVVVINNLITFSWNASCLRANCFYYCRTVIAIIFYFILKSKYTIWDIWDWTNQLKWLLVLQGNRKRKNSSSGAANSTGTGNTVGPSPNSPPSTHTPGDGITTPTSMQHVNNMHKTMMMNGSEGTGSLASASNLLVRLLDFIFGLVSYPLFIHVESAEKYWLSAQI